MVLVCFISTSGKVGAEYRRILKNLEDPPAIEIFDSPEVLARRLGQLPGGSLAVLLVPAGAEDLERLLKIKTLLTPLAVVLVAPDQSDYSLAMGHQLRPRFLAAHGTDPGQVLAVTDQVLKIQSKRLDERRGGFGREGRAGAGAPESPPA